MTQSVSAFSFPYQFNPPPHPSLQHVVPDPSVWTSLQNSSVVYNTYDEFADRYAADALNKRIFDSLRLGRIVMANEVMSFSMRETGVRYGFRFPYNPTTIQGSVNVGDDFIPDPTSTITAVLQDGLERISFELLLNRMPEVQGQASRSDYKVEVSQQEFDAMRERGTHYDVEYLYRVANGTHNTRQRKSTGDIGMLLPNPCFFFVGPFRTKGTMVSVSVTDQIFSPDMVPMLSYVQIEFMRIFSTLKSEYSYLEAAGITVSGGGGASNDSTAPSAGAAPAPGGSPGGDNLVPDPSGTSGKVSQATDNMYDQFMAAYRSIVVSAHCWRENGYGYIDHPKGHACDFMLTTGGHPSQQVRDKGWVAARWLVQNHEKLGVGYVIWDRKIWSRPRKSEGWRTYKAGATTSDPSTAHTNHIHVTSISHPDY